MSQMNFLSSCILEGHSSLTFNAVCDDEEDTGLDMSEKSKIIHGMQPKLIGGLCNKKEETSLRQESYKPAFSRESTNIKNQPTLKTKFTAATTVADTENRHDFRPINSKSVYDQAIESYNSKDSSIILPSKPSEHPSAREINSLPRVNKLRLRLNSKIPPSSVEKLPVDMNSQKHELDSLAQKRSCRGSVILIHKPVRNDQKKASLLPPSMHNRGTSDASLAAFLLPEGSSINNKQSSTNSLTNSKLNHLCIAKPEASNVDQQICKEEGDNMRIDTNIDCAELLVQHSPFMEYVRHQSLKKEKESQYAPQKYLVHSSKVNSISTLLALPISAAATQRQLAQQLPPPSVKSGSLRHTTTTVH